MGPEFLTLAFKFAHEADPDAKLFYNDYNIENGFKHGSSMVLLKRLIADGAPIYGVGIQGHWNSVTLPFAAVDKAIADYFSLGLKVSISELDVTIRGQSGGQLGGRGRECGHTSITTRSPNPGQHLRAAVCDPQQTQGRDGTRHLLGHQRRPLLARRPEPADLRRQQPAA